MTSWNLAYRRHGRAVLSFLIRRLGNREEAEDLCQETFVRAMKADGQLRDPDRLRPYLFRIAHNLMCNHLRRQGLVLAESKIPRIPNLEIMADPAPNRPDRQYRWLELTTALANALELLPDEQKLAFELGVLQRLPYGEICSETGWSLSKVKINVYRARKKLTASMRKFHPEGEMEAKMNGGKG
jgi:RNA polymerase sigma-70 factor, ECF subfamily